MINVKNQDDRRRVTQCEKVNLFREITLIFKCFTVLMYCIVKPRYKYCCDIFNMDFHSYNYISLSLSYICLK